MSALREQVKTLIDTLPEAEVRELLHFAKFLTWQVDRAEWQAFGQAQFARAYGPNEPDYTEADIKSGTAE